MGFSYYSQISEWLKVAGLVSVYKQCDISAVLPLVRADRSPLDKWVAAACGLLVTKVRDDYFTELLPITLSRINRRPSWNEDGEADHEIPLTRHFSIEDYKDSTVGQYIRVLRSLCLFLIRACVEDPHPDAKSAYGVEICFTTKQKKAATNLHSLIAQNTSIPDADPAAREEIITAVYELATSVLFVSLPSKDYGESTFMRFVAFSLLSPSTRRPVSPRDAGVWLSSVHFVMKVIACAKVARDQGSMESSSHTGPPIVNDEEVPLSE